MRYYYNKTIQSEFEEAVFRVRQALKKKPLVS